MKRNTNAIKTRMPKSAQTLQQLESTFIDNVEKVSLGALTLDELAQRYDDIDQQSQLIQGQILLEARNRFSNKNEFGAWVQEMGGSIASCGKQHRTTLMNLARYFQGRDLKGISITAAYIIAAPINADVADKVYEYAKTKNLPISAVRNFIAKEKGEIKTEFTAQPFVPPVVSDVPDTKPVVSEKVETIIHNDYITGSLIPNSKPYIKGLPLEGLPVDDDSESDSDDIVESVSLPKLDLEAQIMQIVNTTSPQLAIVALKNCMDKVNALRYPTR